MTDLLESIQFLTTHILFSIIEVSVYCILLKSVIKIIITNVNGSHMATFVSNYTAKQFISSVYLALKQD